MSTPCQRPNHDPHGEEERRGRGRADEGRYGNHEPVDVYRLVTRPKLTATMGQIPYTSFKAKRNGSHEPTAAVPPHYKTKSFGNHEPNNPLEKIKNQ